MIWQNVLACFCRKMENVLACFCRKMENVLVSFCRKMENVWKSFDVYKMNIQVTNMQITLLNL